MDYYFEVLGKYVEFNGRARRAEYWMFTLVSFVVSIVLAIVDGILGLKGVGTLGLLGSLYSLAVFLPGLAVSVRRLHDSGRSGWWMLLVLTGIGAIVLLIFMIMDSEPGTNAYGPNPKQEPVAV